ncbi:zinc finger protein ZFP2-like [Onthophagus taurus]|uniref:zinc finger protein ZFP2-like n=1 Tax=Onthophagus taurus TaxID=166361 RepID=UPI0039BE3AA4
MDLDLNKICRVCMKDGIMMPIFKVNVSKKLMSCASVQVWPNDNLPKQICNKCSAKLHISFQFKKLCEKSDAKLRQYVTKIEQEGEILRQQSTQQSIQQQVQVNAVNGTGNCVFIECAPILDMQGEEKFVHFNTINQPHETLTQVDYNIHTDGHHSYNLQAVQVYNGTYTVPVQDVQPGTIIQNQVITTQIPIQNQIVHQQQSTVIENETLNQLQEPDKDKLKKEIKIKKETVDGKICRTCNKMFSTTAKLTRHMKIHSADMPYKCNFCNKAFTHSSNFKIHLRSHTDERPYRCSVCNKGCRQAQDLEKHMRTHTGERPHKCDMCEKAFSTSSNLIAHKRIHTGERPYVCSVCQKAFCQSNELTKHMRTHTGEKPHVCDICHKAFNGSSALIVHRRSHTGERPYICIICNKGFIQSSCLSLHLKRHNREKKKLDEELVCHVCDERFATKSEFKNHNLNHFERTQELLS